MIQNIVIIGNTPSKSNSYKVIRMGGRCGLGKQKKLYDYEKSFLSQISAHKYDMIESEFKFVIDVYYPSRRSDLDNSLKVVLDCLQKCNAIKNDNKCMEIQAKKFLDKLNPRIEFSVIPL